MQNKGAIRLFAILLALACAYYLMFTWIAYGIEGDAEAYAQTYASSPGVAEASKKISADLAVQKTYVDSVKSARVNYYLDSLKHKKGVRYYNY